jgi:hypothetical protein
MARDFHVNAPRSWQIDGHGPGRNYFPSALNGFTIGKRKTLARVCMQAALEVRSLTIAVPCIAPPAATVRRNAKDASPRV